MRPRTIIGGIGFLATIALAGVMIYLDRMSTEMIILLGFMSVGSGLLIAPNDFKNIELPWGNNG